MELITCVMKYGTTFHLQIFQKKHSIINKHFKKYKCLSENEKKEIETLWQRRLDIVQKSL